MVSGYLANGTEYMACGIRYVLRVVVGVIESWSESAATQSNPSL